MAKLTASRAHQGLAAAYSEQHYRGKQRSLSKSKTNHKGSPGNTENQRVRFLPGRHTGRGRRRHASHTGNACLIGIQFVVITLIANMGQRTTADSISAFATPTVVHLAAALFVSAIMSVPWPSPSRCSLRSRCAVSAGLHTVQS